MEETTSGAAARNNCVVCSMILPMFDRMWSEVTNDHFRNARVEFLKGIRSLIDSRIEHLSRQETKGTRVVVE
jgi:hypothetical protein